MTDLTDFLLARIAEDEGVAREAHPHAYLRTRDTSEFTVGDAGGYAIVSATSGRVLAECEAKRRIVEELAPDSCSSPDAWGQHTLTLELLALPYADHEDYRDEWRP